MRTLLELERIGEVTVVTISQRSILKEEAIEVIGRQLFNLLPELSCRNLILNLGRVEKLATLMIAKILVLHRMVVAAGGRLALCHIRPDIYEGFEILHLTRFLNIYAEEQQALQSF